MLITSSGHIVWPNLHFTSDNDSGFGMVPCPRQPVDPSRVARGVVVNPVQSVGSALLPPPTNSLLDLRIDQMFTLGQIPSSISSLKA